MGGDSSYLAILRIAGFLVAAWTATKLSKLAGISSIVAEITTGVVLGPYGVGLMPAEYSECEHGRYISCEPPAAEVFDDGFGELTPHLTMTAQGDMCDKAAYAAAMHRDADHGAAVATDTLNMSFRLTGVIYSELEDNYPMLKMSIEEAIKEHLEQVYMPELAHDSPDSHSGHRRLNEDGHGDSHDTHDAGAHDAQMGHDIHEGDDDLLGVNVTITNLNGYAMVEVHITVPASDQSGIMSALNLNASMPQSLPYFQRDVANAVKAVPFIGLAGDMADIRVVDIYLPWNEQGLPSDPPIEVYTGFILLAGRDHMTSLYWQNGSVKYWVDQSHHVDVDNPSYLKQCYDDQQHTIFSAAAFDAIHLAGKWMGCDDMCNPATVSGCHPTPSTNTPAPTAAAPAPTAAPTAAPPAGRRLAGGGGHGKLTYATYGECLVKECKIDMQGKCQRTPDVFTLIGHSGVAMMIFESGMHFDFKMARIVGPWACVVAVLGTILPMITGALLTMAFGSPFQPDGLTAGTALAPTSVGISLRLLGEAGVLNLEFGQTIMTAAFVDDILSLVLFNVIFAMGHGEISFMGTFFPSVLGIAFMLVAVVLAVVFWPWVLRDILLPKAEMFKMWLVPRDEEDPPKVTERDEALFGIMLLLLIAYATFTFYCGTHLWGCFIAGMSFACLDPSVGHPHHVWVKQTKRITSWMIRIFFCCTVAFAIPVDELLQIDAFLKGSLMGIGPCILTKVSCAFFMGPPKFVIGWAMVGRAEFAYLIAQMGAAGNMVSKEVFSILIWALLWATIFAPLVFRLVLNRYIREHGIETGLKDGADHGGHDAHATTRGVAISDEEDPGHGTNGKMAGSDKKGDTIGKHNPWEDDLGNDNSKAKLNASPKQEKGKCCGLWKKAMM